MNLDVQLLDDVCNGDTDFKKMLIGMVKDEVENAVPLMLSLAESNKIAELHTISHKLKTSLGYLNNENFSTINTHIEKATTKTEQDKTIIAKVVELNYLLPQYIDAIENFAASI
jgi:tRNA G26 N,N-dimethylase Trm1